MTILEIPLCQVVEKKRDLIKVSPSMTVADAMEKMTFFNVLGLPVFGEGEKSNEPLGILTIGDILAYVAFDICPIDDEPGEEPPSTVDIAAKLTAPISDILGLHEESKKPWLYGANSTVKDIIDPIVNQGLHRLLILHRVDANNHPIYRMLTQTDVVRALVRYGQQHQKSSLYLPLVGIPELNMEHKHVHSNHKDGPHHHAEHQPHHPHQHHCAKGIISIDEDSPVLQGFRRMELSGVTALPVLRESAAKDEGEGIGREVISNLSISDLRGLDVALLEKLCQTEQPMKVVDFLQTIHGGVLPVPMVVTGQTSLFHAMLRAMNGKVHRLWIVDNEKDMHIRGVLSLTDMIRAAYSLIKYDLDSHEGSCPVDSSSSSSSSSDAVPVITSASSISNRASGSIGDWKATLRHSSVLVSGMSALGATVAKHLLSAGVGRVGLHDCHLAQKEEVETHPFLTLLDVGHNRARVGAQRLANYGGVHGRVVAFPDSAVEADPDNVPSQPNLALRDVGAEIGSGSSLLLNPQWLGQWQAVVLIEQPSMDLASEVDKLCRAQEIAFVKADAIDGLGALFTDFGDNFWVHSQSPPMSTIVHQQEREGHGRQLHLHPRLPKEYATVKKVTAGLVYLDHQAVFPVSVGEWVAFVHHVAPGSTFCPADKETESCSGESGQSRSSCLRWVLPRRVSQVIDHYTFQLELSPTDGGQLEYESSSCPVELKVHKVDMEVQIPFMPLETQWLLPHGIHWALWGGEESTEQIHIQDNEESVANAQLLHVAYHALSAFNHKHHHHASHHPEEPFSHHHHGLVHDHHHAEEIVELARSINSKLAIHIQNFNEGAIKKLVHGQNQVRIPFVGSLGSIVAEEVLMYLLHIGKPVSQWLYLTCADVF